MFVRSIDSSPFHSFEHVVATGGGSSTIHPIQLYRGTANGLPDDVDAIVIASDLQGVAPLAEAGNALALVGEVLAEQLGILATRGELPPLARVGVVLAGDLYSAPRGDVRGATGDVREVWRAFARRHPWVVGVAGNHDTFGSRDEALRFKAERRIHVLDGDCVTCGGVPIGGVSHIIGNPSKPLRVHERDFLRALRTLLARRLGALVLHHGPDANDGALRGHAEIRRALENQPELLVICGHVYWPEPLAVLRGGTQVLNVDGRVVVLARA
jgi:Icc protein